MTNTAADVSNTDAAHGFEFCSVVQSALDSDDINFLVERCKSHLSQDDSIPSYVLLNEIESDTFQKIKRLMEERIGEELFYLNDFYIYTDATFQANWHMDTELFTFDRGFNAWILLSPDEVESPLAFIDNKNDGPDNYFHSVKVEGDVCNFMNYASMRREADSLERIEAEKICAPSARVGDILIIDPKKFHKTNIMSPKHVVAIKFVARGPNGFMSPVQVPEVFWAETKIFKELHDSHENWSDVTAALRARLESPKDRKALSAGFFPEKMELYRTMVQTLQ